MYIPTDYNTMEKSHIGLIFNDSKLSAYTLKVIFKKLYISCLIEKFPLVTKSIGSLV